MPFDSALFSVILSVRTFFARHAIAICSQCYCHGICHKGYGTWRMSYATYHMAPDLNALSIELLCCALSLQLFRYTDTNCVIKCSQWMHNEGTFFASCVFMGR